ncbi:MAG: hypothetical protein HYV09_40465 [Deltaproteobacteria bacterium]|nr:hypothetical protein [Deltaproteobacteria bacterium]
MPRYRYTSRGPQRRRRGPLAALLAVALGLGLHAAACSSDARATDTCRRIESARCAKAAACPTQFPDFAARFGTVASCQKFYDIQCGRGVQDAVKEPSKSELESCVKAINDSCPAALAPETVCTFLTANEPPPPPPDTGAPEAAAEAATDAPAGDAD